MHPMSSNLCSGKPSVMDLAHNTERFFDQPLSNFVSDFLGFLGFGGGAFGSGPVGGVFGFGFPGLGAGAFGFGTGGGVGAGVGSEFGFVGVTITPEATKG